MRPRFPCVSLVLLAALGCGKKSPLAESPGQDLREKLAEMRDKGFLNPPVDPEVPEEVRTFHERLDEIDAWLDVAASWEEPLPDWLDPGNRGPVLKRLETLEPFYEQMTALLQEPFVQEAIEGRSPLARRTSIREKDVEVVDAHATPPRARLQRWIDLLCADAMMNVGLTTHSERTIRSMTQALDLCRLLDDRTLSGSHACAEMETIILLTLRRFAVGPKVDPVLLQTELEPRLAHLGAESRVWNSLMNEVSYRVDTMEVLLREPGRPGEDYWLTALDVSRARLANRALDVIYVQEELRKATLLCARLNLFGEDHPLQAIIDGVRTIHTLHVYCQLARLALAINAYRFVEGEFPQFVSDTRDSFLGGAPPLPPCRSERVVYDQGYNYVNIKSISRMGRNSFEDDDLLAWNWTASHLKAFRDREPGPLGYRIEGDR